MLYVENILMFFQNENLAKITSFRDAISYFDYRKLII